MKLLPFTPKLTLEINPLSPLLSALLHYFAFKQKFWDTSLKIKIVKVSEAESFHIYDIQVRIVLDLSHMSKDFEILDLDPS